MTEPTQFLVNEKGEKIAVVISIDEYEQIMEELEDLQAIREYDEAKTSGEIPVPAEQVFEEIRRNRK